MNWDDLYKYRWQLSLAISGLILSVLGILIFRIQNTSSPSVEVVADTKIPSEQKLIVEVAGAVNSPGVYEFESGARITDALSRAGGVSEEADTDWLEKLLNQAAVLQDGQKLYIPRKDEQFDSLSANNSTGGLGTGVAGVNTTSGMININLATQKELESLWGIGPVTAQNIIEQRPYSTIEELVQKGILKTNVYERNKDKLSVY